MLNESLYFFEQTDFKLRFARCSITETSLHIDELKEFPTADGAPTIQLAPAGSQIVCALRPKSRQLHLASAKESKTHSGLAGLQQFAQLPAFAQHKPAWFAGVQATDGTLPASNPWLISFCSADSYQQSQILFEAMKLKPARRLDASIATAGAIVSAAQGLTLILEIGELNSLALLVGPDGVHACRSLTLNLDQIAEAVQNEMGLKFRGSAAKLFFNPDCDFTDSGPNIAARLATALKADLAPLLAGQAAPTGLFCSGLPAQQSWLERQLSTALGIAPYIPDINAWSANVGMTYGKAELTSSLSPAWFNFLHFINSQTLESTAAVPWQAELLSLKAPIAAAAKPASNPPMPAAAAPVAPAPAKPAAAPAPAAAVQTPKAAEPAKAKPAATPAKAAPTPTPTPAPAAKPAQPAAPVPVAASSAVRYSAKPEPTAHEESEPKSKMPIFIGIGVLVVALLGGGYQYMQSQKAEAARIALEKEQIEQKAKAEEERARLAEQKARQETETRKKFEFETSQKLAAAEQARQQAESEARTQAATRLANARGTLLVTTKPAGATVTVGDQPPTTSPARFNYIKIGKYPVTITLARHEEVKLELEVTENNTTESGLIELESIAGSVALTSEPTGVKYELRPANSFSLSGDSRRTGQTPATVNDLEPGDYSVTYSQTGWAPHTETITIARKATTRSSWTFPSGTLRITSTPSGATVSQDGDTLGVTPLTVRRPPGAARYDLKLSGHDTAMVPAMIEVGKTIELAVPLAETDTIFGPGELDQNPEPINPKTPTLAAAYTLVEGRVVIQLTIGRDGTPTDLKLVRASNPEIGKIYLAAVAKWKFKPGMKNGKPVRSAVVIPFLINPSRE